MPSCRDSLRRVLAFIFPLAVYFSLLRIETQWGHNILGKTDFTAPLQSSANRAKEENTFKNNNNQYRDKILRGGDEKMMWKTRSAAHRVVNGNKELPRCAADGKRAKSFLVIFMGHSGSTAIISELRQHSKVLIEAAEAVDHDEWQHNTSLALQRTRELFSRGLRQNKTVGFKMRPWHIGQQPDAWVRLAKEFDTRIIWQFRNNILKQAVGEYSYKYLNDRSVIEGLKTKDEMQKRCKQGVGCRFTISNFEFFHRTLKDCLHSDLAIMRSVNLILNGSSCVHALPYEDYLYRRKETISRLVHFLGLEDEKTKPERFKATSDSLCAVVENWNEVCKNFYGCHVWRHMFQDERNGCWCNFASGETKYCDTIFQK